jgi:hypothetical protein
MEKIKIGKFFTYTDKLDGTTGNLPYGKRSTAAGITIQLGKNKTGKIDGFVEGSGNRNCLLTQRGICHQNDLIRTDIVAQSDQFSNHGVIDLQASGGIKYNDIIAVEFGMFNGFYRNG